MTFAIRDELTATTKSCPIDCGYKRHGTVDDGADHALINQMLHIPAVYRYAIVFLQPKILSWMRLSVRFLSSKV